MVGSGSATLNFSLQFIYTYFTRIESVFPVLRILTRLENLQQQKILTNLLRKFYENVNKLLKNFKHNQKSRLPCFLFPSSGSNYLTWRCFFLLYDTGTLLNNLQLL